MRGRLTSSQFVGRQLELAELELAFREAGENRPGVVLLGGDSGVGKTRLVSELEHSVPEALVLHGECLEQGDGELPYAPLLGALRPLVRGRHPVLEQLSPGGRTHLASLLPSLGETAGVGRINPESEGAGQLRLFEALLELFDLLSAEQPVLLILEDMHWADRSTRTFTAFLARGLRTERLLLVLTYRSDELHRRHPLRPLLAELDRLERARRIALEPFDRAEMAEVLTDLLGETPDGGVIDRLLMRTEGNPLYVEELLAAGLDGRGAAPQSLRDAFMLRIERLSPDARLAARTVAVGRRLDQATIAEVAGLEPVALLDALREAVADYALIAGPDGNFRFRHALLREVVYDDLLPGERGDLHLALAAALERRSGETDADEEVERVASIATHYAAAGDQPAALRATVHAAQAAERVHAYGEVADLAERALDLWPRVSDAVALTGLDHVDVLELASLGHRMGGDRARGATLLEHALEELDQARDPRRFGRLLFRLARIWWSLNRGTEALDAASRALGMLPPDEANRDRAALLAWLARTRVLRGHYRDAVVEGELALDAARKAGNPCVVGEVLNTLGMANIALGRVDDGESQLRRAMEVAREEGDPDDVGTAYCNLADLLSLAGRTRDALEVIKEGLVETPQQFGRTHDWMTVTLSMLAFEAGDWATARANPGPSPSMAAGMMLIFRQLRDAELALGEGDLERAAASLAGAEPLVRVTSEAQWHGAFGSLCGELHRRTGDLDGGRVAVQRALDELEVCTDDVMRIARVTAVGLGVEADRAVRARDLKETGEARDALKRAKIHLDRLRAAAEEGGPVERAWCEVGSAEDARGRGRNDPARWHRAAVAWDALDRPYPAALSRWREAEALVEKGDREAAAVVAGDALAVARELGAGWLAGEVEALIARGRLVSRDSAAGRAGTAGGNGRAAAGAGAAVAVAVAEETPFGLTPRELQVLGLLAGGATNRQIGAALFMAEKTASVHVSRILAKLGVSSRTQAAAVAHRMHLT